MVENGLAPQLPLEAVILQEGGFDGLNLARISISLQYWRVNGETSGEITLVPKKKLPEVSGRGKTRPIGAFALFF